MPWAALWQDGGSLKVAVGSLGVEVLMLIWVNKRPHFLAACLAQCLVYVHMSLGDTVGPQ